jgi:hypothetical protein
MIAFVEPPMADMTVSAFSNASRVMISRASRGSRASATACRPVAVACRSRSPDGAGGVAPPGSIMPSASVTAAMVDAVPITMQVPAVLTSDPSTSRIRASSSSPLRWRAQNLRQSVQAPRRSPSHDPASIEPTTSTMTGTSDDAAAISWAGTVLSQPPSSTTASIGCARISSSVSRARRLR